MATRTSEPVSSASLKGLLLSIRQPSVFPPGSFYISDHDLWKFVSRLHIKDELDKLYPQIQSTDDVVTRVYCNALKTFCILTILDAGVYITEWLRIRLDDAQLPVDLMQGSVSFTTKGSSKHTSDIPQSHLSVGLLSSFVETQWMFLCPDFDRTGEYHNFDPRTILPIAHKESCQRACGEKWVEIVTVHRDHIGEENSDLMQLSSRFRRRSKSSQQAWKQLVFKSHTRKRAFEAELRILLACRARKHDHIVSLLMSFSWSTKHYIVLPLAMGDLTQLWSRQYVDYGGSKSAQVVSWMCQQIKGLISALCAIHSELWSNEEAVFGLHGDIKAKNVLVFNADGVNPSGTLKWTDFGMGVLCADRVAANHIVSVNSLGTHEPPECQLRKERSQKSDIWSLGCLMLEFIIWCVDGKAGLDEFDLARIQVDFGYGFEFTNDYFYAFASTSTLDDDDDDDNDDDQEGRLIGSVNSGVKQYIHGLRSRIHQKSLMHALDMIEESLLQVNPEKRKTSDECYLQFEQIVDS